MAKLELRNLHKTYGSTAVVNDVNLQLQRGERLANWGSAYLQGRGELVLRQRFAQLELSIQNGVAQALGDLRGQ